METGRLTRMEQLDAKINSVDDKLSESREAANKKFNMLKEQVCFFNFKSGFELCLNRLGKCRDNLRKKNNSEINFMSKRKKILKQLNIKYLKDLNMKIKYY
jgi:hypothetical protein